MRGTPWEPVPGTLDDAIPVHVRMPEEEGPPPKAETEAGIPTEPQREIKKACKGNA